MTVKQLSVFLENREGRLQQIFNILKEANVNVVSVSIAETSDYGIVRMIADDSEKAMRVLSEAGHTANVREVTAFAVPDEPGGLAKALNLLESNGVNIEYLYALVTTETDKAYTVLRTDDSAKAEAVLAASNIELLDENHI